MSAKQENRAKLLAGEDLDLNRCVSNLWTS